MLAIPTLMATLAQQRPVFHAEADFQHAFAWEIHRALPDAQVRLELPVFAGDQTMHVDIWVTNGNRSLAVELKYKKRALEAVIRNERFNLKNDGAQDLGRYDFIKDVERLERIVAHIPQVEGYAVLLTNDSGYWKDGATTVDAAFRLPEGRSLTGELAWGSAAGKGTTMGRERALQIAGRYPLAWQDYAEIAASPTRFRWLAVHVPACG